MSSTTIRIFGAGLLAAAVAMYAPQAFSGNNNLPKADTFTEAASRGAAWLVSVQGHDGGWGHDGAELDGNMGDARANGRVRQSLEKCVAKIQKNQLQDGSWNIAGGWAPILGTSMASRSLFIAQAKGVPVSQMAMFKVQDYTQKSTQDAATVRVGGSMPAGVVGGVAGGIVSGAPSAGVSLYQGAQALEQLSRTEADRKKNAVQINSITKELSNPRFVTGFGSMGGEEFFSYLNISDSLHRTGGPEWVKWNNDIKAKLIRLQNDDGTWAGHHCITGRVAVTSAAILTLLADRDTIQKTN